MIRLTNYPIVFFVISFVVLWASVRLGAKFAYRLNKVREDFNVIFTATLTLLGLLVSFTFSMAVGRYDERKHYEEEEANAIGTEYSRAELLPPSTGENMQTLLREYLAQRIAKYQTRNDEALEHIDKATGMLQTELWDSAKAASGSSQQPPPVTALIVSGMNDVLNSQGYAQAARLNRIPLAAWMLLSLMAIVANIMVGFSWQQERPPGMLSWILPAVISVALLLISDIDSPRRGLIHVNPVNMMALAHTLAD